MLPNRALAVQRLRDVTSSGRMGDKSQEKLRKAPRPARPALPRRNPPDPRLAPQICALARRGSNLRKPALLRFGPPDTSQLGLIAFGYVNGLRIGDCS